MRPILLWLIPGQTCRGGNQRGYRDFPDSKQLSNVGINLSERNASQENMTVLMLGRHLELGLYRAEFLRSHGYSVIFPESRQEAVALVNAGAYDLVIMSYSLSHDSAMELRELIDQSRPQCPIITLTEQRWHDTK